jgi:hypothetical protein
MMKMKMKMIHIRMARLSNSLTEPRALAAVLLAGSVSLQTNLKVLI